MRFLKKFKAFVLEFIQKFEENEIIYFANALTYRILLALFPFIIFLITLLGFFDIGLDDYLKSVIASLPEDIKEIFLVFIEEVVCTKNISVLSISLFISVFSASSGFNYLIKGINKTFDIDDGRNFIKQRFISVLLVFVFSFLIIASLILFIFCDAIKDFFSSFSDSGVVENIFGMTGYLINASALFIILIIILKISLCEKIRFRALIPGALVTVSGWLFMSKVFNIYVNNFSKVSVVYGGLGSVFILLVWINVLSVLILSGSQINAILAEKKQK